MLPSLLLLPTVHHTYRKSKKCQELFVCWWYLLQRIAFTSTNSNKIGLCKLLQLNSRVNSSSI